MTSPPRGVLRCGAAALLFVSGAALAAPAAAAAPAFDTLAPVAGSYPVSNGTLTATSRTTGLAPGSSVAVTGGGYQPGGTIELTLFSTPVALGTATADGSGTFKATVKLPADTAPGTHTIQAVGPDARGGTRVDTLTVEVGGNGAADGKGGRHLADTGGAATASVGWSGGEAAGVAAAGVALAVGAALTGRRMYRRSRG
ncbi:hypothetical protein HUT16_33340 [Kitasatospora sp. NA04385]|uniref:hypothetical protein n=1 Tax=Kitasatospora sp. NA04385 TaxID=2742135 RepID=UPI00159169E4|nr:hypothetical protein [Kitasatospora sp. NA04385]QKW23323.1 hypothetical protein HUT16_33340 [Kitasatospora sp. NA04385]